MYTQIAKIERAVMLKPRCSSCYAGHPIPVVCEETDRPHFHAKSAAVRLTEMRKSKVGWLVPEDDAKVTEWREKIANGELWFK